MIKAVIVALLYSLSVVSVASSTEWNRQDTSPESPYAAIYVSGPCQVMIPREGENEIRIYLEAIEKTPGAVSKQFAEISEDGMQFTSTLDDGNEELWYTNDGEIFKRVCGAAVIDLPPDVKVRMAGFF